MGVVQRDLRRADLAHVHAAVIQPVANEQLNLPAFGRVLPNNSVSVHVEPLSGFCWAAIAALTAYFFPKVEATQCKLWVGFGEGRLARIFAKIAKIRRRTAGYPGLTKQRQVRPAYRLYNGRQISLTSKFSRSLL